MNAKFPATSSLKLAARLSMMPGNSRMIITP
jgi:hypothetical protein